MKLKLFFKSLGLIFVILLLSMIYQQQYSRGCDQIITKHIFDFIGIIYSKGILEFIKAFSWAFLVFSLFLLPGCFCNIKSLIELIGTHLVNYGKATNSNIEIEEEPTIQNVEEKKEFEKEKNREIDDKEKNYKQRKENIDKLEKLIFSDIQKQNIEGFTENSKVVVTNDPISNVENLYFDCSYRYKGKGRARRYVNTLFVSNSLLFATDRIYKYIRIMNDVNIQRNNQRYIIEVICLNIEGEFSRNDVYEKLLSNFSRAIENGVLAIKKYQLNKGKAKLLDKEGWLLDI